MSEQNGNPGTGIDYPVLEIDGKQYTVKFSRAAFYRLDKAGFDLRKLPGELQSWFPRKDELTGEDVPGNVRLSVMIDVLHAAIGDQVRCTPEQLAEMLPPDRTVEVITALVLALSKIKPPAQTKLQEAAASSGASLQ